MNRRSNKILKDLILKRQVNICDLKDKYGVQERTIRSEVKEINNDLRISGLPSVVEDSKGSLCLEIHGNPDIRAYEEFIAAKDFYSYILSKNERTTILAMILLNANGYITVDQLKEKTGVSRNTLLQDLQDLKGWFKENGMELISQVRRGYIIDALEIEVRNGILKLLEMNGDDNYYKDGYNLSVFWNLLMKEADVNCVTAELKELIIEEEERTNLFLTDYSFFEALTELTIICNRMIGKCYLPGYYSSEWVHLSSDAKYDFSNGLFERIREKLGIDIREVEILYYTQCLGGKSYFKGNIQDENTMELRVIIAETIYEISSCFGIDFYLDFTLYDLLEAHMKSAVHRIRNNEVLANPLKETIKKDYPKIFRGVEEHLSAVEGYIGKKFSEDEMSFIVLYYASVLEKQKVENEKNEKISVTLVCATGRGTAQFMLAKLKQLEDMIEIVGISSSHNMKETETNGTQLIISTIPLDKIELPFIEVRSAMLEEEDILDIQRKVIEIRKGNQTNIKEKEIEYNPSELNIQGAFFELLEEERVEVDYSAADWEDAVRRAGNLLYRTGAVESRYVDEMIKNIKRNGPYIVVCPGTALPHASVEQGVIKEAASILRLKEPIDFHSGNNDPVRYVIAMSIQSAESINRAIYDLIMIFGTETVQKKLDQATDAKMLLNIIKQLETENTQEGEEEWRK
ncbi:MAG: BglG family transcription antiterminator [Anaerostipes sp.]|jgi:mannitol operon transcriptional antiterminator